MVDLHTHLLPGVDDGARDLRESVAMCRLAAEDGCEVMVATPHQRHLNWANDDVARLAELRDEVQAAVGERMRVLLGGEIRVDDEVLAQIDKLPAPAAGVLALAGSRYLLLELDRARAVPVAGRGPRRAVADDPRDLVHELVLAGWRPILAHPEFFPWLLQDGSLLEDLVARGATLQVTAMSITGDFGRTPQDAAHRLIDAGLVHFVASDCHGVAWRPPGLSRARRTIAARWGEEVAARLTRDNPRAVIEDRPLAPASPASTP